MVSWGELADYARADRRARRAGDRQVGILLRNQPAHVAALLGVLLAGGDRRGRSTRPAATTAPGPTSPRSTCRSSSAPPTTSPTLVDPVGHRRRWSRSPTSATAPTRRSASAADGDGRPGVAVRMLTSGTTGPPKRVDLTYDMLARACSERPGVGQRRPTAARRGHRQLPARAPRRGVPGPAVRHRGPPFVLLPRFELRQLGRRRARHRPRAVSLVPAALRMVLHSDLTRDDLAGVRAVISGTARCRPTTPTRSPRSSASRC